VVALGRQIYAAARRNRPRTLSISAQSVVTFLMLRHEDA
jgi:hypothetical protein